MKKLFILCLLLIGCSAGLKTKKPVLEEYKNNYLASVAICNDIGETYGSGVIIHNKKGDYIKVLTVAHVAEAMYPTNACYTEHNKIEPLVVVNVDHKRDIAILRGTKKRKVDGPYALVAKDEPPIGSGIYAIVSSRYGLGSMSFGNISDYEDFGETKGTYKVSTNIIPGNSGGGVFNQKGEVIGVVVGSHGVLPGMPLAGRFFVVGLPTIKYIINKPVKPKPPKETLGDFLKRHMKDL